MKKRELIEKLKEFGDDEELIAEAEIGNVVVDIELRVLKFKSVTRRSTRDYKFTARKRYL